VPGPVWPSEGETISDRDARNVIILHAEDAVTVTWSRYSSGERGPELHLHREHTDAFYVLSGALRFALGRKASRSCGRRPGRWCRPRRALRTAS
jgi:quercetin dioxygenase-like cupin family protein